MHLASAPSWCPQPAIWAGSGCTHSLTCKELSREAAFLEKQRPCNNLVHLLADQPAHAKLGLQTALHIPCIWDGGLAQLRLREGREVRWVRG